MVVGPHLTHTRANQRCSSSTLNQGFKFWSFMVNHAKDLGLYHVIIQTNSYCYKGDTFSNDMANAQKFKYTMASDILTRMMCGVHAGNLPSMQPCLDP